jgi:Co/Zn/Cd efflux system component
MNEPRERALFALWLGFAGAFVTFVHDYAYRRTGGDDFEMWGLVSHAGADMLITTAALIVAALVWTGTRYR